MKTLFLAGADRQWAGARFRAWNVAERMEGATCLKWNWEVSRDFLDYDAVIFQKPYGKHTPDHQKAFVSLGRLLASRGIAVYWDLCDPIWWWNERAWIEDFLECCTGVVVSNAGLQEDFRETFGARATVIRDSMPYEATFRTHEDVEVPRLVWFGYATNRGPALTGVSLILSRLIFEGIPYALRIIDDHPETFGWEAGRLWDDRIEYVQWDLATFHRNLCECDVALLPPFPAPWGEMKSDNKTASAYWAGLPVVDGTDYYATRDLLLKWDLRSNLGAKNRLLAEAYYDVEGSVAEWQHLLQRS